LKYFKTQV